MLCAKTDELSAVIEVFDKRFDRDPKGSLGYGDHVYTVSKGRHKKKLMVTACKRMGHVSAAMRTAQILARNGPQVMAFVGTAASLDPTEIQLGDVVIPDRAFYRHYAKISQKGQRDHDARYSDEYPERFFKDNILIADLETASPDSQDIIAPLIGKNFGLSKEAGTSISMGGTEYRLRDPKLVVDVDILSCGMVVDSLSYRDFLVSIQQGTARKVRVIDMESFGFFEAAKLTARPDFIPLMIRGISDYAGRKQQTEAEGRPEEWKKTATMNAALVAATLFETLAERAGGIIAPSMPRPTE